MRGPCSSAGALSESERLRARYDLRVSFTPSLGRTRRERFDWRGQPRQTAIGTADVNHGVADLPTLPCYPVTLGERRDVCL